MKQKITILLPALLFLSNAVFAQSVGISDKEFTVHPSAMLEIQSTNKGVLIPRVSYTQRMYIQTNAQAVGLLVYQTDRDAGFYYFDGLAWKFLPPQTASDMPTLSPVATSGSYEDLKDKPVIPTKLSELEQDPNYSMYVTRAEKEKWNSTAVASTFTGSYNDLTDKPTIPTELKQLIQDSDWYMTVSRTEKERWNNLSSVELFSGNYGDLLGKPKIPTMLRELTQDDEFMTMTAEEKAKLAGLKNITFDGNYNSLLNLPTIPTKLSELEQDTKYYMTVSEEEKSKWNAKSDFSGSYNALSDKPDFATVATTGDYRSLLNLPTIPTKLSELEQDNDWYMTVSRTEKEKWNNVVLRNVVQDPDYAMYVTRAEKELWNGRLNLINAVQDDRYAMFVTKEEKDRWNNVAGMTFFSGDYNALSNRPNLASVATTGSYTDLQNTPVLAKVASTGSYEDLSQLPKIPTKLQELEQDMNYHMTVSAAEKNMWNNKSEFSGKWESLENRPAFATVATTGNYKDLSETPIIPILLRDLVPDEYYMTVSKADKERWDMGSSTVEGKAPLLHTHKKEDVTDFTHTHIKTEITDFPEFGGWSDISQLEIGTSAGVNNGGSMNQFARIDHVHTIDNYAPTQNIGTKNQTIVNTEMLHSVLIAGFGNVDKDEVQQGDIISGGYEDGNSKYKLNIRKDVILAGKPKLEDMPSGADLETVDYIATTKYLAEKLAALEAKLSNGTSSGIADAFSKQLPIGTILMWTGVNNPGNEVPAGNVPPCWEIVDGMIGKFPAGVGTKTNGTTSEYIAGSAQDRNGYWGATEHYLKIEQMPAHNHWFKTGADGKFDYKPSGSSQMKPYSYNRSDVTSGTTESYEEVITNYQGGNPDWGGASSGVPGARIDGRPPFYGVYFIQKMSNQCDYE